MKNDNTLEPAVVVSPGESIEYELDARGWTQRELARKMRQTLQSIE